MKNKGTAWRNEPLTSTKPPVRKCVRFRMPVYKNVEYCKIHAEPFYSWIASRSCIVHCNYPNEKHGWFDHVLQIENIKVCDTKIAWKRACPSVIGITKNPKTSLTSNDFSELYATPLNLKTCKLTIAFAMESHCSSAHCGKRKWKFEC